MICRVSFELVNNIIPSLSLIESKSPKNKAGHGHGHGGKGHHGHGGRGHHGHHEKELLGYKALVEQLLGK